MFYEVVIIHTNIFSTRKKLTKCVETVWANCQEDALALVGLNPNETIKSVKAL